MADTQTLILTDFLLARIAEDEAVAREAEWREPYGTWEYAIVNQSGRIQSSVPTSTSGGWVEHLSITHDSEGLSDSVSDNAGPHIARHDPARVLARCEADRRIVERAQRASQAFDRSVNPTTSGVAMTMDLVLQDLAAIYVDHPDYREEWKP